MTDETLEEIRTERDALRAENEQLRDTIGLIRRVLTELISRLGS